MTNKSVAMVKFQSPVVLFIILIATIFFHIKNDVVTPVETSASQELKLIVERGAFHYDRFELTPTLITYFPGENAQHTDLKYNSVSKKALDSIQTMKIFEQLDDQGFWNLKNKYKSESSCTSGLKITLIANGKRKIVICEDYERGCPELVKYIDQKVVELEGNDLKRIYLPG